MRARALLATLGVGLSLATKALPQAPGASAPAASGSSAPATPALAPGETCRERVPAGKDRPKLSEKVPARATRGHAFSLVLTLEHGKGETVLPGGLQLQGGDSSLKNLEREGLFVPDPDGGAGPLLERSEQGDRVTTRLEIPFLPLPPKPGRNQIVLPSLPVSIARASGDVLVLCTQRHELTVEDPIANTSNPMPKANPPPRPQREEWTALKQALAIGAGALVLGALVAWLAGKWLKRARPVPPPPPPRPPWEVALEELFDVRHAGLVAEGRLAEHFDRVSDTIRKYLGARFGFDGLESTTREALAVLRKVTPPPPLEAIESFLRQADLVKFAKTAPSAEEGELALVRAENIVRDTLPQTLPVPAGAEAPGEEDADGDSLAPPAPKAPQLDEAAIWGPKPKAPAPSPNVAAPQPADEPPKAPKGEP
ncbi:MAG TPA: hypothetical protein VGK73_25855 [Polyangiaceae bacterium]